MMKWLTWDIIRNIIPLHDYYIQKKNGYVIDYVIDRWEGITPESFDVMRTYVYVENIDKVAVYCLRDAENHYEKVMVNCVMDFEGFEDELPIRECSFVDFLKLYGKHILQTMKKENRGEE